MFNAQQIPSSAQQIFKALEDVEHSEFGEMGGRLYVVRDSSGQIHALNQKGKAASFNQITTWVKEALSSSDLDNTQKAQMLERYNDVLKRFKFKMEWHSPTAIIAFFRGQIWSARKAEKMIIDELGKLGYENNVRESGGYRMRGKFKGNQLILGVREHFPSGLIEKGSFKDDHLEGQGISCTFHNLDPTIRDGKFVKGHFVEGTKIAMYSKTNTRVVYQGSFDERETLSGRGIKIVNGDIYEGNFTKGIMEGPGKVTWKGEIYEGHFQGIEGTLAWTVKKTTRTALAKLLMFIGTPGIVLGSASAVGKYEKEITQPGTVWEGTFVKGKLKGEVKIILPDGRIAEGNFNEQGKCESLIIPPTAAELAMKRNSKW